MGNVSSPPISTINLPLTDWVRFERAGHYTLSVRTSRVNPLTLDTNAIEFDVIPADANWQAQELRAAVQSGNLARLRALGTLEAARQLARNYRSDTGPFDRDVLIGLLASPYRQAGADEMRRELRDPDFAVTPAFLNGLALLETPPPQAGWPGVIAGLPLLQQQLSEVLRDKRGTARVTSTQTWLSGICELSGDRLTPDQGLALSQIFEQLPPKDQLLWLGSRWTQAGDLGWLELLRRLAGREVNLQQQRNLKFNPVVMVSKMALQRWYELDPTTGREAILREITKPTPVFGADALGILPDQILPEEQYVIASNFAALKRPEKMVPTHENWLRYIHRYDAVAGYQTAELNLTSLLLRFASQDVLSEVLPVIQANMGGWNCEVQQNAIAFVQKVDQEAAKSIAIGANCGNR
jgi:hypothetical protein